MSVVAGTLAMAAMLAASAPVLIALLTYSVVCSLTLLLTAAICSIRASEPSQTAQLLHPQV